MKYFIYILYIFYKHFIYTINNEGINEETCEEINEGINHGDSYFNDDELC